MEALNTARPVSLESIIIIAFTNLINVVNTAKPVFTESIIIVAFTNPIKAVNTAKPVSTESIITFTKSINFPKFFQSKIITKGFKLAAFVHRWAAGAMFHSRNFCVYCKKDRTTAS